jgi:hypothetical protein
MRVILLGLLPPTEQLKSEPAPDALGKAGTNGMSGKGEEDEEGAACSFSINSCLTGWL